MNGSPIAFVIVALGFTTVQSPVAVRAQPQLLKQHFTPRDQQIGRYQYLPFDVPSGTSRIGISYRYDRNGGANVIDLGLFEPGSLALGTPSYRGSSGGARDTIAIGLDEATPGYWPGPIPAGQWHVMLGLYKVGREGVDVEVTVETSRDPVPPGRSSIAERPTAPIRKGPAWYAGALHAHTTHSDGALTPAQLADKARGEGLDFLAITDHNNTAHQLETPPRRDLLLVVGEEVTTPGGHFNVWGLGGERDYVDFRVLAGDRAIDTLVEGARTRGAVVSINHPAGTCFACSWTHAVPDGVNAIEISDQPAQALAMWDVLLRQGRRIAAVGTSDWHRGDAPLGSPCVRVWADDLSTPAILAGIRAGRVVVVANAQVPAPDLVLHTGHAKAKIGDEIRLARGEPMRVEVRADPADEGARVDLMWNGEAVDSAVMRGTDPIVFDRFATTTGYLRVHVTRPDGVPLAITNPIYVVVPLG